MEGFTRMGIIPELQKARTAKFLFFFFPVLLTTLLKIFLNASPFLLSALTNLYSLLET